MHSYSSQFFLLDLSLMKVHNTNDGEGGPGRITGPVGAHSARQTSYDGLGFPPVIDAIFDEIVNPGRDDFEPKRRVLGNMRLTSIAGIVIFFELVVIGVTVPAIGQFLTLHVVVGYMLIPPLLLKLGSTSYRFVRYYIKTPRYAKAGPPTILLRVIAPLLVTSTVVLMVSGVVLMVVGPNAASTQLWKTLHQASFILWFGLAAIHIIAYFPKAAYQAGGELGLKTIGRLRFSGVKPEFAIARIAVAVAFMLAGVVMAALSYDLIGPWSAVFNPHFGVVSH